MCRSRLKLMVSKARKPETRPHERSKSISIKSWPHCTRPAWTTPPGRRPPTWWDEALRAQRQRAGGGQGTDPAGHGDLPVAVLLSRRAGAGLGGVVLSTNYYPLDERVPRLTRLPEGRLVHMPQAVYRQGAEDVAGVQTRRWRSPATRTRCTCAWTAPTGRASTGCSGTPWTAGAGPPRRRGC